jgi:hypothetical protein
MQAVAGLAIPGVDKAGEIKPVLPPLAANYDASKASGLE